MKLLSSNIIGNGSNDLIILHGFLGMGDNWKSFAKKITNMIVEIRAISKPLVIDARTIEIVTSAAERGLFTISTKVPIILPIINHELE